MIKNIFKSSQIFRKIIPFTIPFTLSIYPIYGREFHIFSKSKSFCKSISPPARYFANKDDEQPPPPTYENIKEFQQIIIPDSKDHFLEIMNHYPYPTLVKFTAEWCNPCKLLQALIDKKIEQFKGRFTLVVIDVDELNEIAAEANSVPSMFMMYQANILDSSMGMISEDKINKMISSGIALHEHPQIS